MSLFLGRRSGTLLAAYLTAMFLGAPILGARSAQAQVRGSFQDVDADHDGRVTLQEFEAYATQRLLVANGPMAQRFRQLSPQQQAARLQQRFQWLDRGNKGYLDPEDWRGS